MPDTNRTGNAEPAEPEDTVPAEHEDVQAHGVETEDDTEAASIGINFGCSDG